MANDRHVIQYLTPAELIALMNASGVVTVNETGTSDGKPVIHAAVKVVNAETGEHLPGGLPFSVVMFKGANEPGYSNIAIGTIVPASELKVALPRDYFNFCNQRFRFTRAFPLDERSFVIQMDLVLKNATREYVKFSFGLWGALFSQMLFELMGRGRESLIAAAEAYALAHTDFAQQVATAPVAVAEPVPVGEPAVAPEAVAMEAVPESEAVLPLAAEAIVPQELALDAEAPKIDEENPADAMAEPVSAEVPAEETVAAEPVAEEAVLPVEIAVEMPEASADATELELSIAAGPAAEPLSDPVPEASPEPEIAAQAGDPEDTVVEPGETKEAVPA